MTGKAERGRATHGTSVDAARDAAASCMHLTEGGQLLNVARGIERSHVGHARACAVLSHGREKKARAHTQHVHANPLCGISIVSAIDFL